MQYFRLILGGVMFLMSTIGAITFPVLWPLIFISFVPWLYDILNPNLPPSKIVILSLGMSVFCTLGFFGWAAPNLSFSFGFPLYVGVIVYFIVSLIAHSQFIATNFTIKILQKKSFHFIFTAAFYSLFYSIYEMLIPHFLGEKMGYWVYQSVPISQLASVGGVSLLSFWIILNNGLISELIRNRKVLSAKTVSGVLLLLGLAHGIIYREGLSLQEIWDNKWRQSNSTIQLALVSGKPDFKTTQIDPVDYISATERILQSNSKPDLILWPEVAVPFYVSESLKELNEIRKHQKKWNIDLMFGGFHFVESKVYNSVFFMNQEGSIHTYYKRNPVPLSESNLEPGLSYSTFDSKLKVGPLICYDAQFTDITKQYVKQQAKLLIVFTKNLFLLGTPIPYYQFQLLKFRAIETRLPIVQVASEGISGWFSPSGVEMDSSLKHPGENTYLFRLKQL